MYLCPTINNLVLNNKFDRFVLNVFMAFYIGMVIVYLLVIKPLYIDRDIAGPKVSEMMANYYNKDNIIKVLGMDIIFIVLYFSIAYVLYQEFHHMIPIEYHSVKFLLVLVVTIIVVDLLVAVVINAVPYKSSNLLFFRKWGKTAGYKAIVFDIILLVTIGIVALLLEKWGLNSKWHFLSLVVLVLIYFFSV